MNILQYVRNYIEIELYIYRSNEVKKQIWYKIKFILYLY